MKKCTKCKLDKPLLQFNRNKNRLDGYDSQCKGCCKERYKARVPRPATVRGQRKCSACKLVKPITQFCINKSGPKGRNTICKSCVSKHNCSEILYKVQARAKQRNIYFNLSKVDVQIPKLCPLLKIPLITTPGKHTDNTPSIDRISPLDGYVPHNVQVISMKANRIKNNATFEEFETIYQNWKKRVGK